MLRNIPMVPLESAEDFRSSERSGQRVIEGVAVASMRGTGAADDLEFRCEATLHDYGAQVGKPGVIACLIRPALFQEPPTGIA